MKITKEQSSENPSKLPDQRTDLVNQMFYAVEKGKLTWQGVVIGNPEPGWYLIQLYSHLTGNPTNQRLVKIESMSEWLFFDDKEQMEYSYTHGTVRLILNEMEQNKNIQNK
jgi:hypothetical protein